jgi:hypothetical protein
MTPVELITALAPPEKTSRSREAAGDGIVSALIGPECLLAAWESSRLRVAVYNTANGRCLALWSGDADHRAAHLASIALRAEGVPVQIIEEPPPAPIFGAEDWGGNILDLFAI